MLFRGPHLLLCGPYYTVTIVLYDNYSQLFYRYLVSVVDLARIRGFLKINAIVLRNNNASEDMPPEYLK